MSYNESLIGFYQIDENVCDDLIDVYNRSEKVAGGFGGDFGYEIDTTVKNCMQVEVLLQNKEWDIPELHSYFDQLQACFNKYYEDYDALDQMPQFDLEHSLNIQKYESGGHYGNWHYEWGPLTNITANRCLTYMTYLNDVPEKYEGQTEFKYQNIKVQPKKGLTLIWPAYFTHLHRGCELKDGEKYIITGWWGIN